MNAVAETVPEVVRAVAAPLSAEELHAVLKKAFVLGNHVRRKFITALLAMEEGKHFRKLGFSSIAQYAERHFGCTKSTTYGYLDVARRLPDLPLCDAAFGNGTLSWTAIREVANVATAQTDCEWLEFASEHSIGQLHAEVADARRKKRDHPRKDSYGLPNLTTHFAFDLAPEEGDLLTKALAKAREELGVSLGSRDLEPKDALLYMAKMLLETNPAEGGCVRLPREESIYTILYRLCPDCRKANVATPEGPVEIPTEVVERVEPEAVKTTIAPEEEEPQGRSMPLGERDRPNTPELVRKVVLRDGQKCANPMCRRTLGLHAHHLQFRSLGGRTALFNESALCPTCHSAYAQRDVMLSRSPNSFRCKLLTGSHCA